MTLTESIDDIVAQAAGLLSPPDMSDWAPDPSHPDPDKAEAEESERRSRARLDAYLADRSDRLACLRAIRQAAQQRAEQYADQAQPWLRQARRQEELASYCEALARGVLEAERQAAGFGPDEAYEVQLPSGLKMGLRLSTPAVRVLDVEDLPGRFVKVTKAPNKKAIAAVLKAGKSVSGAELVRGNHVYWGR